MGIGATVSENKKKSSGELFSKIQTEDLTRFGMIPEFLGRLPMIATLEDLDEKALIEILTKPKNAIIKQYMRLMEMEGVKLSFEDAALNAVAKEAIKKKTGARGLRSILENAMLDVMYEIPSLQGCTSCLVQEDAITKGAKPILGFDGPGAAVSDAATFIKKESA